MKHAIKNAAVIAFILIVPAGTLLIVLGASYGIGGLDTVQKDAVAIKKAIVSWVRSTQRRTHEI